MLQSSYGLVTGAAAAVTGDVFMPEHAPFVVLAFLGTVGALLLLLAVAGFAVVSRRPALARGSAVLAAAGVAAYLGALLFVSGRSAERVLKAGERKYFCEIDCHLAYSVEGIRRESLGGNTRTAVLLRTWFDVRTISSRRGNGPLTPNPRRVCVIDDSGRRYAPSPAGSAALSVRTGTKPLTTPLRPGESYMTLLTFELPAGVSHARLLLTDADPITRVLIGHEGSLKHKKIYFDLG